MLCDSQGTPWLLEVNQDPSLHTTTQVDLDVKSRMLVDLLNLVRVGGDGDGGVALAGAMTSPELCTAASCGWTRLVTSE